MFVDRHFKDIFQLPFHLNDVTVIYKKSKGM